MTEAETISIVGFCGSTKGGFSVIGRCWRRLHAKKGRISGRADEEFLIGVNDYSYYPCQGMDKVFRYIAGAEVAEEHTVPRGMQEFTLPAAVMLCFPSTEGMRTAFSRWWNTSMGSGFLNPPVGLTTADGMILQGMGNGWTKREKVIFSYGCRLSEHPFFHP